MEMEEKIALFVIFCLSFCGANIYFSREEERIQANFVQKNNQLIIEKQKETIKALKIELLKTKNVLGKRSSLPSRHSNFNRGSSFIATAYTHTGNNTASGEYPEANKTIAVDPRIIPLGSKVRISCDSLPDYDGVYTAQDTGRDIKGKRVDVFTNTRSEAINFGKRHILVEVLK